ncbi:MAG: CarboxypepD reg-like domain [Thermoplasmata archaeon]|nr:CarboxypepD reg-like domain [Thermoplasmata archaeon]
MRPGAVAALAFAALLAGCSQGQGDGADTTPGPVVDGLVVDAARIPIGGAAFSVQGQPETGVTDEGGRFEFEAPPGVELLVTVQAAGFVGSSQLIPPFSGDHHDLVFLLERLPSEAPYVTVEKFDGIIRCGLTAVVGEDPSRPHEHKGVRCDDVAPMGQNIWNFTVPVGATGLVLEGFWEPRTELSTALILKVTIPETGDIVGFVEQVSPLRLQFSKVALAQNLAAGHDTLSIVVTPGAGTGNHDHGAVGVFVDQDFRLIMTSFFNGPVDPAYTVAG